MTEPGMSFVTLLVMSNVRLSGFTNKSINDLYFVLKSVQITILKYLIVIGHSVNCTRTNHCNRIVYYSISFFQHFTLASIFVQFLRSSVQEVQYRADRHPAVRRQPAQEPKEFGPSHLERNCSQDVWNRSRRG